MDPIYAHIPALCNDELDKEIVRLQQVKRTRLRLVALGTLDQRDIDEINEDIETLNKEYQTRHQLK